MASEESTQLVWMITGCASGFGRRFVPGILRRGDKVIATSRKVSSIETLPEEMSQQGFDAANNLRILELDLEWGTTKINQAVEEALSAFGRIDVLINNGGVGMKSLVEEADAQRFTRQFQINVFGHIDVTNAVLPHMRARKSGTIVVMGSRSTWRPELPAIGLYASSKAALTEGMLMYPYHDDKRIPEYDLLRSKALEGAAALNGKQPGDPVKGVEVILDVVRGEGKAAGRKFPRYLPLGTNAAQAVKEKTDIMMEVLEEWKDVIGDVEYEQPDGTKMWYS
ncbi:hypothetical protein D9757_008988 [Collybiopsis confluens]|uniref:NAD(P)-binding protein n=1 Tax=Collybiopsis confluens TaxID=2823264 RepID=A0A8H5M054_9AGAR|nr:hypothetical protein D9757_008988 [Collybiopsis confluens]